MAVTALFFRYRIDTPRVPGVTAQQPGKTQVTAAQGTMPLYRGHGIV